MCALIHSVMAEDTLGVSAQRSTQLVNLRASYGGTLMGLGAFVAWLPALRPWKRTLVGLVMWAMAGIGIARLVGFVLDGSPDGRQLVWIIAEVVLVVVTASWLRRIAYAGRRDDGSPASRS